MLGSGRMPEPAAVEICRGRGWSHWQGWPEWGSLFPLGLFSSHRVGVLEWASLVPLGKVTPFAVAWRERVTCRNTMVLNRPWPGQLIDRIYYSLYFKSLNGSCLESRRVFDGHRPLGCCAGHASRGVEHTRPAGAKEKSCQPPSWEKAGPSELWEEGRVSPAPACSCWPA